MNTHNSGDAVALAVDRHWPSPSAQRGNPFENPTWIKSMISGGQIVPPPGESAAVRRLDYLVGLCVICLVVCGLVGFSVAYFWRA